MRLAHAATAVPCSDGAGEVWGGRRNHAQIPFPERANLMLIYSRLRPSACSGEASLAGDETLLFSRSSICSA